MAKQQPNLDQLIEYVQRELNTKRFLSESADFLKQLRSVGSDTQELQRAKQEALEEAEEAKAKLKSLEKQITSANELVVIRQNFAAAVVKEAEAEIKKMKEDAQAAAKKAKAEAEDRLNSVEDQISDRKTELDNVTKEVEAKRKELKTIEADKAALMEKLK